MEAMTLLDAKQYDAAIEAFTKASALDDKQVVVWAGLADAYVAVAPTKGAETAAYSFGYHGSARNPYLPETITPKSVLARLLKSWR